MNLLERLLGSSDPVGEAVLLALGLVCIPYYATTHPVKTYRLLVHRIGWYE